MDDSNSGIASQKLVSEFEETLVADGKALKTAESYTGDVRAFLEWLESKGNIFTGNLKRFHITSYKATLYKTTMK